MLPFGLIRAAGYCLNLKLRKEFWLIGAQALPNKTLIAGVGARAKGASVNQSKLNTIEMAEQAARNGADALLVYPPTWLKSASARDDLIVDLHSQLSRIGLPLILFYLYEAAGGISIFDARPR